MGGGYCRVGVERLLVGASALLWYRSRPMAACVSQYAKQTGFI